MSSMSSVQKNPIHSTPDHVPAELVWNHDFDEFNNELDDPFIASARLHGGPGILWAQGGLFGEPAWLLTKKSLIEEAFRDPDHFSSERNEVGPALGVNWKLTPLEYDPPEHYTYRKILNPFFSPQSVGSLDEAVRGVCDEMIAKFQENGGCEFIGDFAEMFPSYVFLDLMGLPRDMLPSFLDWERELMRAPSPEGRLAAMKSVLAYLETFVREQHSNPGSDLMKGIFSARKDDGSALTNDEIMGMVYLFYVGGLDTVYSTLGWIFRYLTTDFQLQERLRDNPDKIPQAVEEFLRAFPVARPHRIIKKEIVFHGVEMKVGDIVLLPTWLAGRDPEAYDNPHQIDIDRKPRHITFATGPHICLGIHLAKRELKMVLEAFLSRFRNIRLAPGDSYKYHTGGTLGVDRLVLEWDT